jgi:hypothetical protein
MSFFSSLTREISLAETPRRGEGFAALPASLGETSSLPTEKPSKPADHDVLSSLQIDPRATMMERSITWLTAGPLLKPALEGRLAFTRGLTCKQVFYTDVLIEIWPVNPTSVPN